MATFLSSLLRKIKGRIDHLVLYEAKGQQRLRSLSATPLPVASPAQRLQRCRLRAVVAFYRANRSEILRHIWKVEAEEQVMSGYNLFLSTNIQAFNESHRIEDYGKLQICMGKLEIPPNLHVEDYHDGKIRIRWRTIFPEDSQRNQDRLWAAWLSDDGSFSLNVLPFAGYYRKDEKAILEIPEAGSANIHLYIYFSDNQQNSFSKSKYFYLSDKNE